MLYWDGKGRYQTEYDELWKRLVPLSGQADTIQGELVRAIGRLASEYYRNGGMNWDMGFRMLTNTLYRYLRDPDVFDAATMEQIEADIAAIRAWGSNKKDYGAVVTDATFDRLTDRVVEWCQKHSDLLPRVHNPKLLR